jgi:hypothetical protein
MAKQIAKTITRKNGDIFVPVKSFLGQYYLQFRPSKVYNLFGVWRVMEPTSESKPSDVYVGEVHTDSIENDRADSMMLPFEDIRVMMKMAKKLGGELYVPKTKKETTLASPYKSKKISKSETF